MPWPLTTRKPAPTFKGRLLSPATVVSFVMAGAFLLFLVTRFDIDLAAIGESFKASNPFLFVLALLVHYTTFLFRGARWWILLKNVQGDHVAQSPNPLHCSSLILMGWFANSVTWFRLGDAYRAHAYAGDTGGSFSRTIGTILAERLLDMGLVLLLLALATFFLALNDVGISWVFLGLAAIMAVGLAGIILMMSVFRSRLARVLPGRLKEAHQRFHQGTVGSFQRLPLVTLLGALGWMAEAGRLFLVVEALGFPLGIPLVIFVTLASAMLTLVPITPGGLGAVEWGVTGLLLLSPVVESETAAFSIVALDRSISWLSVIVVGAAFFLGREVIRRRRRLPSPAGEAVHGKG